MRGPHTGPLGFELWLSTALCFTGTLEVCDRLNGDPKVHVSDPEVCIKLDLHLTKQRIKQSISYDPSCLALSGVTASNNRFVFNGRGDKSLTTFSSHFTLRCFASICAVELLQLLLTCKDYFATIDCPFTIVAYLTIRQLT